MLTLVILKKEVPMREQGQLFGPRRSSWIAMIWEQCHADVRRECIEILAEMGRATLAPRPAVERPAPMRSGKKGPEKRKAVHDEC